MKKALQLFYVFLLIICCPEAFGQKAKKDSSAYTLPLKDSLVHYELTRTYDKATSKDKIVNAVMAWCATQYNNSNEVVKMLDRANGQIIGTGIFDISTGGFLGNNYDVRYTFNVQVKEGAYRIQISHFMYSAYGEKIYRNSFENLERDYFRFLHPKNDEYIVLSKKAYTSVNVHTNDLLNSLTKEIDKAIKDSF